MTFCKSLIAAGVTAAIFGLLVLTFQVTMFLVFSEWYGFTLLDILQRLALRDYLLTGVDGFDSAMDWLLDVPLAIILMAVGCIIGFIGLRMLRSEQQWQRPG